MIGKLGCLFLLCMLCGCTSYPRYRADPPITPEKVGPKTGDMTTDEFVRFGLILQEQLGRPYKGRSTSRDGIDCSMFTQDVYREFNKTVLPRTSRDQYGVGREVPRRRLKYGDLVFFRTERNKISHVGIFIDHNEFIHATVKRGVIVSNMNEKYWAERYAGARRVLGNKKSNR